MRLLPWIFHVAGIVLSHFHLYLGALPDASLYDPSSGRPFGLAEIRNTKACATVFCGIEEGAWCDGQCLHYSQDVHHKGMQSIQEVISIGHTCTIWLASLLKPMTRFT